MLHRVHLPAEPLRRWIEHFWLVRALDYPHSREWIFPEGCVDLMFNLGPSPHAVIEAESGGAHPYERAWVSGSRQRSILVEKAAHGYDLIGVHFRPGGAHAFFALPQLEISDTVVELDAVWGGVVEEIREKLAQAGEPERVFAVLERALLRRLREPQDGRLVEGAVQELSRARPGTTVASIAKSLGVTHRRLISTFDRLVGLKPKSLQRVLRFQRVIRAEEGAPRAIDWAAVALDCGYFDQAHLIRDFRIFTGMTPETYRARRTEYPNSVVEDVTPAVV